MKSRNVSYHVSDSECMKIAIQGIIRSMMDRIMKKVLKDDPFIPEKHHSTKPLYAALVPDEVFKAAHFERRFVTPFGKAWQKLAKVAADEGLGEGVLERTIQGNGRTEQLRRIQEVLNQLEHPDEGKYKVTPDWASELKYIMAGGGEKIPTTVISDLWVRDTSTNEKHAFELKAPLPNSDQTKVSKEKIFKLYCMEPKQVNGAYFALPYNPYGKREDYDWSFPFRWFDMRKDEVVLIGDEFWDTIGGAGTYQAFIEAVNEIGGAYRNRIYREFLGVEPPEATDQPTLR